jgi:hypothetical protein
MMEKKNRSRMLKGLGAAVGTIAAVFGIRWAARQMQRRRWSQGRWQQMESTEWENTESVYGREAIPATGSMAQDAGFAAGAPVMEAAPLNLEALAAPLIEYLLAFNSIVSILRSRQSNPDYDRSQQLQPVGQQESMRNVLEQLQNKLPDYSEADVKRGSLENKTYQMATRVRDVLQNLEYTDDDYLRIFDELRPEVCKIAQALQESDAVTITGLEQIREYYQC